MKISTLGGHSSDLLCGGRLILHLGAFRASISIAIPPLRDVFLRLYSEYEADIDGGHVDFHIQLRTQIGIRPRPRLEAVVEADGVSLFGAFPAREAWPYFEWGLNSCIARWTPHHLVLHAASLERGNNGLMLAGGSGSGKSTLAAALMLGGWRLLSDEFALLTLDACELDPLVRPVCLKNEAIDLVRSRMPEARFGPSVPGARKGLVAHVSPPACDIQRGREPAPPRWLIFVNYSPGEAMVLEKMSPGDAMARAVSCSFNYQYLGREGFHRLVDVVNSCACYSLVYGDAFEAAPLLGAALEKTG